MDVMGRGVGPGRYAFKDEAAEIRRTEDELKAAGIEAGLASAALQNDPLLGKLVEEMESTMLRLYRESPDGKAQMSLLERLGHAINPEIVAKNLARKMQFMRVGSVAYRQTPPEEGV